MSNCFIRQNPCKEEETWVQKKVLKRECKLTYCIVTQIATNLVEFNHCWVIQPKLNTFPEIFSSSQQSKTLEAAVSHCQWWVKANQRAAAVPEDPSWEEAIPDKKKHSTATLEGNLPNPPKKRNTRLKIAITLWSLRLWKDLLFLAGGGGSWESSTGLPQLQRFWHNKCSYKESGESNPENVITHLHNLSASVTDG